MIVVPYSSQYFLSVQELVLNEWLRHYVNKKLCITQDDVREAIAMLQSQGDSASKKMLRHESHVGLLRGKVIAYCASTESESCNWLKSLYVATPFQGKGYGDFLLRQQLARHLNNKPWMLGVVSYNIPAVKLYEKYGFQMTGVTYYMGRIPISQMQRPAV